MKQTKFLLFITFCSFLVSCNDDDSIAPSEPSGAYENGLLIANEGPFAGGYGTVTFIANDLKTVEQNIYQHVNENDNAGNVLNSIGFYEDSAYLVANVSNKITVVDRFTFEKKGSIQESLNNPRHFAAGNGIGFVSNWGDPYDESDDYISVIDLATETIITTISVSYGPENLLILGNKLYVAHKGGYGHNNIISVIDRDTYQIEEAIVVGDVPGSMASDFKGNLWVLCEGIPAWTGNETNGSLIRIRTSSNEVTLELDFGPQNHPQFLSVDLGQLYYSLNGKVYKMRDTDSALPSTEVLSGVYFYQMKVYEGVLYGADAKDYASNGSIEVYNLIENSFVTSVPAGIIPGGIYFND